MRWRQATLIFVRRQGVRREQAGKDRASLLRFADGSTEITSSIRTADRPGQNGFRAAAKGRSDAPGADVTGRLDQDDAGVAEVVLC
jgi:hypothetical protein